MPPEKKASISSSPPKSSLKTRLILTSIISAIVLIITLFIYYQFTLVSGTEFDTGTWTVREFQYRQDLITKTQISGRTQHAASNLISATAGKTGKVTVSATPFPSNFFSRSNSVPSRWDLVEIHVGTSTSTGPAHILTTFFKTSEAQEYWEKWNKDNPKKAAVLWQAARDLVDLGLYYALPSLITSAPTESSVEEFTNTTNRHVIAAIKEAYNQIQQSQDAAQVALADDLLKTYSN